MIEVMVLIKLCVLLAVAIFLLVRAHRWSRSRGPTPQQNFGSEQAANSVDRLPPEIWAALAGTGAGVALRYGLDPDFNLVSLAAWIGYRPGAALGWGGTGAIIGYFAGQRWPLLNDSRSANTLIIMGVGLATLSFFLIDEWYTHESVARNVLTAQILLADVRIPYRWVLSFSIVTCLWATYLKIGRPNRP